MRINQMKSAATTLLLVCLIDMLFVIPASAQFSLGLKVAGNATNYRELSKRNFGVEAGLFMRLGDRFFFQPEANYSFKQSTFTANHLGEYSGNDMLKQHYVSVPLLLGYHFINNDNFKFRLTIGPRFDFKVSDNFSDSDWESNLIQWGGQVGVGIDFWRFSLDGSYCIAADNFRNMAEGTSQTRQLNMFIVSLGFKIIK